MPGIARLCVPFLVLALCCCGCISGSDTSEPAGKEMVARAAPEDASRIFSGSSITGSSGIIGNITVNSGIIPTSPEEIRIFRGYFRNGSLVEYIPGPLMREVHNPVSKEKAPDVAKGILEQYGGLPSDAKLHDNFVMYGEIHNRTTGEITRRIHQGNFVSWYKNIDGIEIEGGSDTIQVELGENGNLTRVYKRWRTYEPIGNVSILPATKAINKIAIGEILNPISDLVSDVEIYHIHFSYYIKNIDEPEITLEPIWVFYGNASGTGVPFFVYARQFANFTATPVSGKTPLTVAFNDTSDASPTAWYWSFGDGTNSTEQHPVHTYTTGGRFNVSLRAWNDLGSDTVERPFLIMVRDNEEPT